MRAGEDGEVVGAVAAGFGVGVERVAGDDDGGRVGLGAAWLGDAA